MSCASGFIQGGRASATESVKKGVVKEGDSVTQAGPGGVTLNLSSHSEKKEYIVWSFGGDCFTDVHVAWCPHKTGSVDVFYI